MVPMNSRRTIRPKRIERSREIYKAIAADAAAGGMTPNNLRNGSWSRAFGNCESSTEYLGELRGSGASSNRVLRRATTGLVRGLIGVWKAGCGLCGPLRRVFLYK